MESIASFVKSYYLEQLRSDPAVQQALLEKLATVPTHSPQSLGLAVTDIVLTEAVRLGEAELHAMQQSYTQATPDGTALVTGPSKHHPAGCRLLLLTSAKQKQPAITQAVVNAFQEGSAPLATEGYTDVMRKD